MGVKIKQNYTNVKKGLKWHLVADRLITWVVRKWTGKNRNANYSILIKIILIKWLLRLHRLLL